MLKKVILVVWLATIFSCAHQQVAEQEAIAVVPKPSSAPRSRSQIKYVYVETPATESAMTIAPFERLPEESKGIGPGILRIFWPLLALLAVGFVLIIGLLLEHFVLNRQLARRAQLKARLQTVAGS